MKNLITINENFKNLLRGLTRIEYGFLEKSILEEGCRNPIIIWNNQIIDGHHRFEICQKHNLEFAVMEQCFSCEEEASIWIMENQLSRRNLNSGQMLLLLGKLYRSRKSQVGAPVGNTNAAKSETVASEICSETSSITLSTLSVSTPNRASEKLAEEYKVSEKTVRRAGKFVDVFEKSDDQTKEDFLKGAISQKALLEIVDQTESPDEFIIDNERQYPSGKNAETEFMHAQAIRLQKALKDLFEKLLEIKKRKPSNGATVAPLERVYKFFDQMIEKALSETEHLKNCFTCEYCEVTGCDNCEQGYVTGSEYQLQIKEIEADPSLRGQLKKPEEPDWKW